MSTVNQQAETVQLTKIITASPEQVFEAWTTPDIFRQWFGCGAADIQNIILEARVGGQFQVDAINKDDGSKARMYGQFQEVIPAEKLVFTWNMDSQRFQDKDTLVTVLFKDLEGKTEVLLTHERLFNPELGEAVTHGWGVSLDKLAARFAA